MPGSSSAGTATFPLVPAGSGYTVGWAYGASTGTTSPSQSVNASPATNTFAVSISTGTVNVTVTVGGTNLSGVTATLIGSNGFAPTASTSGTGVAAFTNVPAGPGYTASVTYGAAIANSSSTTATTGTVAVALPVPVGSITVVTENNSCHSLHNTNVGITALNGYNPGNNHSSGGTGSFTFTNVPAGTGYTVTGTGETSETANVTSGGTTTVTLSPNGTC